MIRTAAAFTLSFGSFVQLCILSISHASTRQLLNCVWIMYCSLNDRENGQVMKNLDRTTIRNRRGINEKAENGMTYGMSRCYWRVIELLCDMCG